MISAIRMVTIGVRSMDEALALFRDGMGMRVEAEYPASPSLLAAWGLGGGVSARLLELSCAGYPVGRVRLAAYDPVAETVVRRHGGAAGAALDGPADVGPKAIDFYVGTPIAQAVELVRRAGYEMRSEPILHEVGDMVSEEFVCWGPDGVPLLFMVGHRHNESQMRPGATNGYYSEVATISIVGGDPHETRRFYADALGLATVTDAETERAFLDLANDLPGVPRGTPIRWLLYGEPGEASGKILVVHFAGAPAKRLTGRMRPGHLGFSLLTHQARDLDALHDRLRAAGFATITPPLRVDVGGAMRRIMLAAGPNEEMFEFVEHPSGVRAQLGRRQPGSTAAA